VLQRFVDRVRGNTRNGFEQAHMLVFVIVEFAGIKRDGADQFFIGDERQRNHRRIFLDKIELREGKIEPGVDIVNGLAFFQNVTGRAFADFYALVF